MSFTDDQLTCDDFLGGRVRLYQPKHGYRAGVDPVLLAAAVPAISGQRVLEFGCGSGPASLCLGARVDGLALTGVELQPEYAELAVKNAAKNDTVFEIITADLRALPADIRNRQFDHVIMNPPYYDRSASSKALDDGRDTGRGGDTPLADWITIGAKRLAPKGYLTMIQRIDRLPESLAAAHQCLGSLVVRPIAARLNREPSLFILQARKNGRAAFRLSPPFIMHDGLEHSSDRDDYNNMATEILRFSGTLPVTI